MSQINKLLVLTSGGDAPGMNAALRAIVRNAIANGLDVYGTEQGYYGLLKKQIFSMNSQFVANCIQRGGTILKTGRCPEFHDPKVQQQCRDFLKQQGIDAMVVLGGDGSFRGASLLSEHNGPKVIGVPCTIDNDINGTEYCIGFDTACNTALEAIDKIRDTALSLDSNFMIEVMGRASGFLAVNVGIAGGAEIILTPEYPLTPEQLLQKIQHKRRKKLTSIIVVAEANRPGHSFELAEKIRQLSGIEYKVCILGHTQRGGSPTAYDRKTASIMGAEAINALLKGKSNKMLSINHGEITLVDFPAADKGTRFFDNQDLLHLNEKICDI